VGVSADVGQLVAAAAARWGGMDVLVNNAGVMIPGTAVDIAEEAWNQVVNINLGGVWRGLKYAIPEMIKRGGGSIVSVSSVQALQGLHNWSAYAASKGGINSLTQQAAIDYAWSRGAVIVAATGNDGSSAPTFPAGDAEVVGVSNTDETDALNPSSNYGTDTFMAAPGTDIYTTTTGGGYTTLSGTSASAAEVAGAAALLRAMERPPRTRSSSDGWLATPPRPLVRMRRRTASRITSTSLMFPPVIRLISANGAGPITSSPLMRLNVLTREPRTLC
jgi:NAD(P)-dependent dehydrogenase (short-subunit alcohol dehydrogenase family)